MSIYLWFTQFKPQFVLFLILQQEIRTLLVPIINDIIYMELSKTIFLYIYIIYCLIMCLIKYM